MTSEQAKETLQLYRPDSVDADDSQFAEALECVQRDPELRRWFDQHCAFQKATRAKFRRFPVPAGLEQSILAANKIIRPAHGWLQPAWLAAAAVIALLIGLSFWWLWPQRTPDRFVDFRARMVRTSLGGYHMDLVTNDLQQLRQFMGVRGAPADYVVTKGLAQLQLTGGGVLRWRNNPVSMICFDRGGKQMLFLFVVHRSAIKDAPPTSPVASKVSTLMTASWSQGDRTYVVAGPDEPDFVRKFIEGNGDK